MVKGEEQRLVSYLGKDVDETYKACNSVRHAYEADITNG
jgi:hypothetical protein